MCGNSAGGNNGAGTCSDTCVGSSLQNCGGPLPTLANYVYTTCPTGWLCSFLFFKCNKREKVFKNSVENILFTNKILFKN